MSISPHKNEALMATIGAHVGCFAGTFIGAGLGLGMTTFGISFTAAVVGGLICWGAYKLYQWWKSPPAKNPSAVESDPLYFLLQTATIRVSTVMFHSSLLSVFQSLTTLRLCVWFFNCFYFVVLFFWFLFFCFFVFLFCVSDACAHKPYY